MINPGSDQFSLWRETFRARRGVRDPRAFSRSGREFWYQLLTGGGQLVLTCRVDASRFSPASYASNDTVSSYAYCIEKLTNVLGSLPNGDSN